MRFLKAAALLLFLSLTAVPAPGVVITSQKMAYVDMEKVYENLIVVHQARAELENLIQQKKEEVKELEKNVEDLRKDIARIKKEEPTNTDEVEESRISGNADENVQNIETPDVPETRLGELKNSLDEKKTRLQELKELAEKNIRETEQSYRRRIMSKIYDVLENIAQKEEYTAVLDGEVIFFTGEDVVDITNKVIEELNEKAREN